VGDEHTSYEIWSKSVQGLRRYVQTMRTDNARDYDGPVAKFKRVYIIGDGQALHEI
jgi:hypothetical protein